MLEFFIFILAILSTITFVAYLILSNFKSEMLNKAKYDDFTKDAQDAFEKNFSSNHSYAFASTKGVSAYEKTNKKTGEVEYHFVSQSKLYDTSIKI